MRKTVGLLGAVCAGVGFAVRTSADHTAPHTLDIGADLYAAKCAVCHGANGDGLGPAAHYLDPKPRDFTRGIFKFKSTEEGSIPTDEDLFRTITLGLPGTAMPSWAHLRPAERWALAGYLKTFSSRFAEEEPEEVLLVGPEPPGDPASVERGAQLYRELQCAECHGEKGRGDGAASNSLTDVWGNPTRPADFGRGGKHMRTGADAADLFRIVMRGIEGTPMPSWDLVITENQVWDVVHFIQSLRQPWPEAVPIMHRPIEIVTLPTAEERGRQYFRLFACAACHGPNGEGGRPNSNAASGEQIPGLRYVAEGYTMQELQQKIRLGERNIAKLNLEGPDPPVYMPAWGSILTEDQIADIATFLFSLLPKGEEMDW